MTAAQRVVLLLLAFSLVAAAATGGVLYIRLAYLWGMLFVGGWLWSAVSMRGLHFERSARSLRAQVGQVFEERFDIHNNSRLPHLWLEVRDESALPGAKGSHVLTLIEARQGRSYLARTRLRQRGAFPLGPTVLASGDLFGLFPVRRSYTPSDTLLVYPMMAEISAFPNPPGLLPGGEALRRRTHQVTPNASGVRDYVPGDSFNRIHWASTARHNRLVVKEFELDPLADVWIFLDSSQEVQAALPLPAHASYAEDFWRPSVEIPLAPSTEEYGVSAAASLARFYLRRDRSVGLVSAGQYLTLVPPDRGARQLGKILESLAILRADGVAPMYGLLTTQAKHLMRGSTIILITPASHLELAGEVDQLVRQGLRPVVILLDAITFGGQNAIQPLEERFKLLGVPVCILSNGDHLGEKLSNRAWLMQQH